MPVSDRAVSWIPTKPISTSVASSSRGSRAPRARPSGTATAPVSFWRALETREWAHPSGDEAVWPDGGPDFGRLDELFDLLAAEESEWKQFFKRNEYEPLTVVYEEYTCNEQSFGSTVREILHFVGIGVPDGFTPPEPGQKQQSDEVTEEIVQRYRARRASLDTSTMG
jgi:LPS sulfotransferase NodH